MNWSSVVPPLWPVANAVARWFYQERAVKLDSPVVSVGNIVAGGVGKTELVVWIAKLLVGQGLKVCVASRGYKSKWESTGGVSNNYLEAKSLGFPDEALLTLKRVPGVWVSVGQARSAVLRQHWGSIQPDVVLLDDGFQHFKIARDLDILVHDFSVHNILRDFPAFFGRAGVRVSFSDVPKKLQQELDWVQVRYQLKGQLPKTVRAFCGIGNPGRFFKLLEDHGVQVKEHQIFSDHHHYNEGALKSLLSWIEQDDTPVLTTLKDFVKLPDGFSKQVQVVETDLRFIEGEKGNVAMVKAIQRVLKP